ncbi:ATPase, partial [Mycobacterium sp. ITM-2017-0098]
GTQAEDEDIPIVAAAFRSGTIGRATVEGERGSPGLNVEAVPVRHGNLVVAVLTHQTSLAPRQASPLEAAYIDCAGDLLNMLSEG